VQNPSSEPQYKPLIPQTTLDTANFITSRNLAHYLGINIRCLERWRREGTGPHFITIAHNTILYREIDVINFLNQRYTVAKRKLKTNGRQRVRGFKKKVLSFQEQPVSQIPSSP
jgi:hypothetical protein